MSGVPYYVHINDNNGKWDWDLMAGTNNLWLYVEFLYPSEGTQATPAGSPPTLRRFGRTRLRHSPSTCA
jgi:hypothetical protein